jgi:hypothetical protein
MEMTLRRIPPDGPEMGFRRVMSRFSGEPDGGVGLGWEWEVLERILLSQRRVAPPITGPLTLGFDAGCFPPTPPACYRAFWQLPGPDFHRQATPSLRTARTPLRHGVTSCSAGRTNNPQWTSGGSGLWSRGPFQFRVVEAVGEPLLESWFLCIPAARRRWR